MQLCIIIDCEYDIHRHLNTLEFDTTNLKKNLRLVLFCYVTIWNITIVNLKRDGGLKIISDVVVKKE